MQHFKNIAAYCKAINISPPKHPDFDIRSFKDNMPTIVSQMPAFRHEFYAIAIKVEGSGIAITGHFKDFPDGSVIFFNSPFQLISWDIIPDWNGYYLMFSKDFIAKSNFLQDILSHFSFLKIEKSTPFEVSKDDVTKILSVYNAIYNEYHSDNVDKFQLIESYLLLLLNVVKRYFYKNISNTNAAAEIRKTDLKILSRFQSQIEISFYPNSIISNKTNPHTTRFYAELLNIHPNHLNAVVKLITGQTAKQTIQKHVLHLAKSRLIHSEASIKEIAYGLHFDSPNSFSSFFKKHTQKTPASYRKIANL